ncbi:MAG: anhydro-N-acetylmuramic acid kinase [Gemmatimonadaceae bacterium]|nr:anhydro-N-acetylmuramic acid kinase [Gemmatimonadaceae bacterium]
MTSPLPPAPILVGLMSGTSLDGIAAAAVRFVPDGDGVRPELLAFHGTPYDATQRERLAAAMVRGSARDYCRLHVDLGRWLADAALGVIDAAGLTPRDVQAIASHGQTLWHEPGHSTWQIGDAATITERTGCLVVHDFRARDMAAGGQGAPLVPLADLHLFAAVDAPRALQNLGGIGNVAVVPARGTGDRVVAFDTGPGNVVIDRVVASLVPGQHYDDGGRIAAGGRAIEPVLARLLDDPYLVEAPPKSTGREKYDDAYVADLIDSCGTVAPGCTVADIVCTATELTARTMQRSYDRFVAPDVRDVVLAGGGTRNPELVRRIRAALPSRDVRLFDDLFFDAEAKEAVAFAYMALQQLRGRPGNVPSATGAAGPRLLGARTLP